MQASANLPIVAKKEADAFKNLQWKTLKGINILLVYYIWYINII